MPAVVLDIEGTVSPVSAVREDLFGYTARHLADWLRAHRGGLADDVLVEVAREAGQPTLDEAGTADQLRQWIDADVKSPALKKVQGHICHEGFQAGELHGRFFPDVRPALLRWQQEGVPVFIYSSGSQRNQQDWFAYAEGGALDGAVSGYFDLTTAGAKNNPESYLRITETIGVPPGETLFLSDASRELLAAIDAGWSAIGVARPGEPHGTPPPAVWVSSLEQVVSLEHLVDM